MGRGYNPYPCKAVLRERAKDARKPYRHLRCSSDLSFPNTLMENEELMHVHWGPVVYTEACAVLDKLAGERYRIHVEVDGGLKKTSLHKLIRKANTGEWGIRMCHMNPKWEFKKRHFYPGSY
jgi:hypothetical protein